MGCMGLYGGVHADETDTVTDVNGFQTHFIGLSIGICLCQCERTISIPAETTSDRLRTSLPRSHNVLDFLEIMYH